MRLLPLLTLLAVTSASAREADPATQLAEAEAKQALALYNSPRAAAHLVRLQSYRDEVEDLNLFAQTYHDLLGRRATDPLVRALTRMLYADIERARGRYTKATEQLEPLGFVREFYIAGAFDNEGRSGCDVDYGPESKPDLKALYPSKWREVGWRKLTQKSPDGYVDLSAAVRPNHEVVAYAATFLDAPQETRATLSLGTSGAFRLWINGQLAMSESRYNIPWPDQARVAVRLRKGTNRVLLKVCQDHGPLGFYLRQERGDGAATVTASLPDTLPSLEKGAPPGAQPLPTLTTLMERMVSLHPDDAVLRGEYATLLSYFHAFDERDRADVAQAQRAADAAPQNAELQQLAAQLEEDDANLRRKYLEAALTAAPTSLPARLALARHEVARNHAERALPLLEALLHERPDFVQAQLVLAEANESLGAWPRAAALTEETFQTKAYTPVVARAAARTSRRLERVSEAVERYRFALALRFDDGNTRRALVGLLAELAKIDQATKELEELLKQNPFDDASRLHLAELLASNGKLERARALFAEAKALAPDEPEVHDREGRALLQAGLKNEALAAFERSLALRPQNPALKDLLRSLKGAETAVGAQLSLEVKPLLAEADALAGEDAVYVVDNTYVRVSSRGLASRFHQTAVKAFTQRGVDAFQKFRIDYAPSRQEVRVLRARVTKPDGSVVESYGDEDLNVNEPWTGMYYDVRAKVLTFPSLSAGDLLEVEYRLDDSSEDNLLSDYWGDVTYFEAPIPKVRFQYAADLPSERPLYWNKTHLPPGVEQAVEVHQDGRTVYRFGAKNLPKVVLEPDMPGQAEVWLPLHVSTYRTWDQVGRYYWGLVEDQLTPNDELKRTVDKVLQGVDRKDELAVIRALYDFVVTNTRYVALEFGIHGFKPYRVDRVLARRFGDCKDKASLIHAMLKVAGVDSRLVLLRMRQLGALGEEPASLAAFNHAILYVPKYQLYLDGTAEFHGARELPSVDRDANALIVEPGGDSRFVTTPEASPDDNKTQETLDVALKADGSARIVAKSTVTGEAASEYRREFQAAATRKSSFEQRWGHSFPGLSVEKLNFNDLTRLEQDVTVAYELQVPRFAEVLPASLHFFPYGTGRSFAQTYAPLVERKFDLVLPGPGVLRSVYRYALPAGFTPGELPADVTEQTAFGRYTLSHRVEGNTLVFESDVAISATRITVKDYPAFRAFVSRLDQAFSRKATVATPGHAAN
jgi:tetratricopeptide (TPR) repeat protein/transglutaminase-like putative cysteine protease